MAEAEVKHTKTNGPHWEELVAVSANAENTMVAIGGKRPGGYASSIQVYHPGNGKHIASLDGLDAHPTTLAFLDETTLLSGHSDGTVQVWDLSKKTPKAKASQQLVVGSVTDLGWTEDGSTLAVSSDAGGLVTCSLPKLKSSGTTFGWPEEEPIHSIAVAPNGEWVAAAGEEGVIRVFSNEGGEATREMPGHDGPIYSLLLHPQEQRLISTGEDRSIRFWYLQGEVEFEDRAAKQSHDGPIRCMQLGPTLTNEKGETLPPRLFTGSDDGTVKVWPLDNKRAPKTISSSKSGVADLSAVSLPDGDGVILFTVNPARVLTGWTFNRQSEPLGEHLTVFSLFHNLRFLLKSKKKADRKDALEELQAHLEDEAVFRAILAVMRKDEEAELRQLAVEALVNVQFIRPVKEIREALNDKQASVRKTGLDALRKLQGETAIAPLTSALQSNYEDLRRLAIQELVPLQKQSPHAARLIRESLNDRAKAVQIAALDALETLHPSSVKNPDPQPLLMALQANSQALTLEVLYRIYRRDWSHLLQLHAPMLELLNDNDEQIRRTTFLVLLSGSSSLLDSLKVVDEAIHRQWLDLEEQLKEPEQGKKAKKAAKFIKPSDAAITKALKALEKLDDQAKQPLFLAQTSRHSDLALTSATLLSRMGDLRAFGTLLQLSQESEEEVRQQTALAFRYLSDPRAEHCLTQLLNDSDNDVRSTSFDTLDALLQDSLRLAEIALTSQNAEVRNRGLQKLVPGKKEQASDEAIALVRSALSDGNESVRDEAFKIHWNLFPKNPEPTLQAAFDSSEELMRSKAIDEIVKAHGKTEWGREVLLSGLADSSWNIVTKAYEALRKVYDKDDVTPQKAALETKHQELRLLALKHLHKAKKAELEPILLGLLADNDAAIRSSALERMLSKYPKSTDTLAQALDVPHWDVKLTVAQHLAKQGDARALEVAAEYLNEEQRQFAEWEQIYITTPEQTLLEVLPEAEQERIQSLRRTILRVVLALGQPEGIEYIQSFLDDKTESLSSYALFVIAQCASQDQEDLLLKYLKHDKAQFQKFARSGLARLGNVVIVPSATEQLQNAQVDAANEALISLYALGSSVMPRIEGLLSHSKSDIRENAWTLLLANTFMDARSGSTPQVLLRALSAEHANLRLQAAILLQSWGDAKALEEQLLDTIAAQFKFTQPSHNQDNAEKQHTQLMKELPGWLAGLTSEDSSLRYAAASLLKYRYDGKKAFEHLETKLRFWPDLSLPKASTSKEDASPYVSMAFGAYAGLLRQSLPTPLLLQTLTQATTLVDKDGFDAGNLRPLLEQALYHPNSSDIRKTAWQHLLKLNPDQHSDLYALAIACPYADVGMLALQSMKEESEKQARDFTVSALQSKFPEVRNKAAEQLQSLFPEDSLEPFILALQSEHSDVRLRVINRLLREQDSRVTEALEQALSSDHEDLRLKAATALADRGATESFDVLVEFLQSEEPSNQRQAVRALLQLKDKRTVEAITRRIDDDPEQTAEKSLLIESLGQLQDVQATDWLVQGLEESNYSLRHTAFNALVALAGPEDKRDEKLLVSLMLKALASKRTDIQIEAMSYMADVEHKDIQSNVANLLRSRDSEVRTAAMETIVGRIPELDKDHKLLVDALDHPDPDIRRSAAVKLGELKEPKAFPVLFATFQTSMDEDEQRSALHALGQLGDPRAFPPVLAMFPKDENLHPALDVACEAIGKITPEERKAEIKQLLLGIIQESKEIPASLELVEDAYDLMSTDHRSRAVVGLRHVAGDDGITLLGQVARECEGWDGWQIRQAVAKELGETEDKAAEPILNTLLNDDDSDVRREAADSLLRLYDEEDPTPYLRFFDNDNFEYEYELMEKATKIIAQFAEPVEILKRLPLLVGGGDEQDLFLDASSTPGESSNEEIPYMDEEKSKVLTLGLLRRDPLPFESTLEALQHEKLYVRMNAIQLLLEMLPEDYAKQKNVPLKAISKALQDTNQSAMKEWEKGQTSPLLPQLWRLSLWSLGTLEPKDSAKSAIAALNSESAPASVRSQAAQTLGMSGSSAKAGVEALTSALQDSQEKVRRQAAWALGQLQKDTSGILKNIETLPSALHHLTAKAGGGKGKSWSGLSNHASKREVVPSLVSQKESPVFINMFEENKTQPTEQKLAIQALGRIADPAAIEQLNHWRQDESLEKDVRIAAYRAWRRAMRTSEKRA
ncbi:MAG: hypothetical protein EP343_10325 [Deltaproteobacteria bacterium]|nr:MAG: hypothetical protein EP343_10325 [Deltaproteobacteria bacterium]